MEDDGVERWVVFVLFLVLFVVPLLFACVLLLLFSVMRAAREGVEERIEVVDERGKVVVVVVDERTEVESMCQVV